MQEKNEWIPVTERLPDAEVEVLTWSEGGDLRVSARDEKGRFSSRCMDSCRTWIGWFVHDCWIALKWHCWMKWRRPSVNFRDCPGYVTDPEEK